MLSTDKLFLVITQIFPKHNVLLSACDLETFINL